MCGCGGVSSTLLAVGASTVYCVGVQAMMGVKRQIQWLECRVIGNEYGCKLTDVLFAGDGVIVANYLYDDVSICYIADTNNLYWWNQLIGHLQHETYMIDRKKEG